MCILLLTDALSAQHQHHRIETDSTSKTNQPAMMMNGSMEAPMSHAYSLNLPMNRNGSGTGWLPDASPMYGYMIHSRKWMYMVHGNIFVRYNNQDIGNKGTRGDEKN